VTLPAFVRIEEFSDSAIIIKMAGALKTDASKFCR
jgi:hypothetical protein